MVLRLEGQGMASTQSGGAPGDLYIIVRTAPDPRFTREGADLWRRESIELLDAVLGTHIRVPTLEGFATVTIPPGTQPQTVLRLKGKGLPKFESRSRGDLFIHIDVHIPEYLGREERELFEQLRTIQKKRTKGAL